MSFIENTANILYTGYVYRYILKRF